MAAEQVLTVHFEREYGKARPVVGPFSPTRVRLGTGECGTEGENCLSLSSFRQPDKGSELEAGECGTEGENRLSASLLQQPF